MGVKYKLNSDVVAYILELKDKQPDLSCRKLVDFVSDRFNISLSKSSVNNVIRQFRPQKLQSAGTFQIPQDRKEAIYQSVMASQQGSVVQMSKPTHQKSDLTEQLQQFLRQPPPSSDHQQQLDLKMSTSALEWNDAPDDADKTVLESQSIEAIDFDVVMGDLFKKLIGAGVFVKETVASATFQCRCLEQYFDATQIWNDVTELVNKKVSIDAKPKDMFNLWYQHKFSSLGKFDAGRAIDLKALEKGSWTFQEFMDWRSKLHQQLHLIQQVVFFDDRRRKHYLDPFFTTLWPMRSPQAFARPLSQGVMQVSKAFFQNDIQPIIDHNIYNNDLDAVISFLQSWQRSDGKGVQKVCLEDFSGHAVAQFDIFPDRPRLFFYAVWNQYRNGSEQDIFWQPMHEVYDSQPMDDHSIIHLKFGRDAFCGKYQNDLNVLEFQTSFKRQPFLRMYTNVEAKAIFDPKQKKQWYEYLLTALMDIESSQPVESSDLSSKSNERKTDRQQLMLCYAMTDILDETHSVLQKVLQSSHHLCENHVQYQFEDGKEDVEIIYHYDDQRNQENALPTQQPHALPPAALNFQKYNYNFL